MRPRGSGPARWTGTVANAGDPDRRRRAWRPPSSGSASVDILVNNAATNPYYGPIMDLDTARADKTVRVNQTGYLEWVQAAWRAGMSRAGRGRAQPGLDRRPVRGGRHRLVQRDQGGGHPPDQPAGRGAGPDGPGQRPRPRSGQDRVRPCPVGAGRGGHRPPAAPAPAGRGRGHRRRRAVPLLGRRLVDHRSHPGHRRRRPVHRQRRRSPDRRR